ncbi:hypothetical protein HC931_28625 [Candidatus Gracilibacteria bacterium]|nr:hypothetical protein [Candidatus Gracilibacteria bacterium]NJM86608.1 hypothetical protein [Hydrococcus sp. RU_2_2]
MEIQILSAISGRLRLRIPRLNHDSNYATQIDGELKVLRFVTGIRINPPASSIAITYNTKTISDTKAKKMILEAIAQPKPVVSTSEELSSPKITSDISRLKSIALTQDKTTPQTEEPLSKKLSEPIIAKPVETRVSEATLEIPQSEKPSSNGIAKEQTPSNEETSLLQESTSIYAGIEGHKNDTITPTLKLSSLALAKRLGISVQALIVRSSQPNFTQWSMTKDPEGIGWVLIKSLNKYYSVSSV